MSKPRKDTARPEKQAPASLQAWASLTWEDLDGWAGSRSVTRGRAYQRQGRVTDLALSADGRLLATVVGGDRYTVSVRRGAGGAEAGRLESRCTCPVGYGGCKHAVAAVVALLEALAEQAAVPVADDADPRWAELDEEEADEEDDDEGLGEEEEEEDEGEVVARPRRSKGGRQDEWDRKIQQHIRAKDARELADLVWSLTQRYPELREEFRERIALGQGDVDRLVAQAHAEMRRITAEGGWRNEWSGEGHTPDYSRLVHRLERLVELGHSDRVVPLGRELIRRGNEQVERSDDEGETATAFGECLSVVFDAVAKSSLPAPQKLLYVIDACLQDSYDVVGESADPILKAAWQPADWSAVADELAGRLKQPGNAKDDEFSAGYRRDGLSNWLLRALEAAGRGGERLAIMEAEARATNSYERLVNQLLTDGRPDDAERWAREGIEKTAKKWPGIAAALAKSLCEMARLRKDWSIVAAHAAVDFFERPGRASFKELVKLAGQAGCADQVRKVALRFLETGVSPYQLAGKSKEQGELTVAPDWPLPAPDYLVPLMRLPDATSRTRPEPYYHVLLELAIADRRADEVLHWYDKIQAGKEGLRRGWYGRPDTSYADSVAAAVAEAKPERALEIYGRSLNELLAHADRAAYESVGAVLRRMRPILERLGRAEEWRQLLAGIRLKHRNRPRFMEVLEKLEGRTILEGHASRGRR
jgi:uncharacterized Zn finger protein